MVLRHQVRILERQLDPRVAYRPVDRAILAPSRGCCRDGAGAPRVAWSAAATLRAKLRSEVYIPRGPRRRPTLNAFRAIEVLLPNTFASSTRPHDPPCRHQR